MASLKFSALLAVAMAVAVIVSGDQSTEEPNTEVGPMVPAAEAKANDLILGKRVKGDKLVEKQVVKKNAKPFRIVTETRKFNAPKGEITQVKAINRATKNAAVATVVSGGVGEDFVELKFKSKRSHGISFDVSVYAKEGKDESGESGEDDNRNKVQID